MSVSSCYRTLSIWLSVLLSNPYPNPYPGPNPDPIPNPYPNLNLNPNSNSNSRLGFTLFGVPPSVFDFISRPFVLSLCPLSFWSFCFFCLLRLSCVCLCLVSSCLFLVLVYCVSGNVVLSFLSAPTNEYELPLPLPLPFCSLQVNALYLRRMLPHCTYIVLLFFNLRQYLRGCRNGLVLACPVLTLSWLCFVFGLSCLCLCLCLVFT